MCHGLITCINSGTIFVPLSAKIKSNLLIFIAFQARIIHFRPGRPKGSRDKNPRKGSQERIADLLKNDSSYFASEEEHYGNPQTRPKTGQDAPLTYHDVIKGSNFKQDPAIVFQVETVFRVADDRQLATDALLMKTTTKESSHEPTDESTINFEPDVLFLPLSDPFHKDWTFW
jgi:hypothetical protein